MGSIADINAFRKQKEKRRPQLITVVREAETGARPFLALASDGRQYWCKEADGPHGLEAMVNEVLASVIGRLLGAPVPRWEILDIPPVLRVQRLESGRVLRGKPVFGSSVIESGELERMENSVPYVSRDGNYNHLLLLFALWVLCNAEDIQVLAEAADDMKLWSIDHGLWFGSYERPWGLGDTSNLEGQTELPELRDEIPQVHWNQAIDAVEKLDDSVLDASIDAVPREWGVTDDDIARLALYALERKNYTIEVLQELRDHKGKR